MPVVLLSYLLPVILKYLVTRLVIKYKFQRLLGSRFHNNISQIRVIKVSVICGSYSIKCYVEALV